MLNPHHMWVLKTFLGGGGWVLGIQIIFTQDFVVVLSRVHGKIRGTWNCSSKIDVKPFKSRSYNRSFPPSVYFPNSNSCATIQRINCKILDKRLENGSLTIIGNVDFCGPPHSVFPLTVQRVKPRSCHVERIFEYFEGCSTFSSQGHVYVTIDDKSRYDHIWVVNQ